MGGKTLRVVAGMAWARVFVRFWWLFIFPLLLLLLLTWEQLEISGNTKKCHSPILKQDGGRFNHAEDPGKISAKNSQNWIVHMTSV